MFFLPAMAGQIQGGVSRLHFYLIAILSGSRSVLCFCKSGATEACGLHSLGLYLTFNKPEYSHVATADYRDSAGDRGERALSMTVQANGEMGSNKVGLLTDPSLADPVCLCEFMATVWGRGDKIAVYCSTSLPSNKRLMALSHPFWNTLAPIQPGSAQSAAQGQN